MTVEFDDYHGAPFQLVKRAVEAKKREQREEKRGRGQAHSQYWCIFDRDEHPFLPEAFDLAGEHGIRTAFSNPCLELWFLWHFQDQTADIHRHAAQHAAKVHLGCDKSLTPLALQALADLGRFAQAKSRALQLDRKHAGDGSPPASNPSSGVWRLIDEIKGDGQGSE